MLNSIFVSTIISLSVIITEENSSIPIIEICDPDIIAAEIFDDAPSDIKISRTDNKKLCDMLYTGWWCWMEGQDKQKCCEKEVNSSGDHTCCTLDNKGQVGCYTNPTRNQTG